MSNKIILPLETQDTSNIYGLKTNKPFFYDKDKLEQLKEELEEFIEGPASYTNNIDVARKFLGCQEIQANNGVEGYMYDVSTIEEALLNRKDLPLRKERIIGNLYRGYQEILEGKEINADNLRSLYGILSDGLLAEDDIKNMGDYYRNEDVYIYYSNRVEVNPDKGMDADLVPRCMDSLFEYLNNENASTLTDHFIKSQLSHYYFVYVHPYFDVNGRTSRTLALWYLLNNKSYPYIIFNRAIPLSLTKYYKIIRDVNRFKNVTVFLYFMMENVKIELEKEYLISSIEDTLSYSLTPEEYQTIQYILSMKGNKTSKDFASFYNRMNEKRSLKKIDEEMLTPLIDKDILKVVRYTKSGMDSGKRNYELEINPSRIDDDPTKIKRLHKTRH